MLSTDISNHKPDTCTLHCCRAHDLNMISFIYLCLQFSILPHSYVGLEPKRHDEQFCTRVNNWHVESVKHLIDKNCNLKKMHPRCVIDKVYISQYTVIHNQSNFFKIYLRNKFRLDISHHPLVFIFSIYSVFCKG